MSKTLYLILCGLIATGFIHAMHDIKQKAEEKYSAEKTKELGKFMTDGRFRQASPLERVSIVKSFIENGADVNALLGTMSLLYYIAFGDYFAEKMTANDISLYRLLLESGANPFIMATIVNNTPHTPRELLEKGLTRNYSDERKKMFKEAIELLRKYEIMSFPPAPTAPIPADLQQILTPGATATSSSAPSSSLVRTAGSSGPAVEDMD